MSTLEADPNFIKASGRLSHFKPDFAIHVHTTLQGIPQVDAVLHDLALNVCCSFQKPIIGLQ